MDAALVDGSLRLASLHRRISPPRNGSSSAVRDSSRPSPALPASSAEDSNSAATRIIPSPVQLTRIRDLDAAKNADTVGLEEILGDPLIRECWQFNYLFDVDFLM